MSKPALKPIILETHDYSERYMLACDALMKTVFAEEFGIDPEDEIRHSSDPARFVALRIFEAIGIVDPGIPCVDCGANTQELGEYYMVTDEVWKSAGAEEKDNLCIGCLEARLGRELAEADLTKAPINWWMINRLRGHVETSSPRRDGSGQAIGGLE